MHRIYHIISYALNNQCFISASGSKGNNTTEFNSNIKLYLTHLINRPDDETLMNYESMVSKDQTIVCVCFLKMNESPSTHEAVIVTH